MGMNINPRQSFKNLSFPKKGSEIAEAAERQRLRILKKLDERNERITQVCIAKGLQMSDFVGYQDAGYGSNTQLGLAAGELAQLREEAQQMRTERQVIEQLTLVIDNLPQDVVYTLDFDELKYLGF